MLKLDKKTLSQLQIAMKLDEYDYDKDTQAYFENMPFIGLFDSQVYFINQYLDILENKDGDLKWEFEELLARVLKENETYQKLLSEGSKSHKVKKYANTTGYLVRQMKKYQTQY